MDDKILNEGVKEWGLEGLDRNDQEKMLEKISGLLYQMLVSRAGDILSENEQKELDSLLDGDNTTPKDVLVFLNDKISNFEDVLKEVREKLKEEMMLS